MSTEDEYDPTDLPAHAIAEYDQALSDSENLLSSMVSEFIGQRREHESAGYPEAVTVVGLSVWLTEECPHEACANALAVAVLAIARQMERQRE